METAKEFWQVWLWICVEVGIVWMGNHFGIWYLAIIIGLLNGAVLTKKRTAFWTAWLASVGGWGLALLWQSLFFPIGKTSVLVTGMMGFGTNGLLPIVLSLLLPFLFATTGVWLSQSLRGFSRTPHRRYDW